MGEMYFKNKYRINSIRLKKWDYSSPGYYFVTMVIQNRNQLLSNIEVDCKINLTQIGKIIKRELINIAQHFNHASIDQYIIMPDHIHAIIHLKYFDRDAINRVSTYKGGITQKYNPMGTLSISAIIRYFKAKTSFRIHKINKEFRWQSRFYERIIRNEYELQNVRRYINSNPKKWNEKWKI